MIKAAVEELKRSEGWRSKPYLCSLGYPTVGWGFRIGPQGADVKQYQFVLPQSVGDLWLTELAQQCAEAIKPHLAGLSEPRQVVLVCMAYQLGVAGLLGFKNMLAATASGDYKKAAAEMLNSRWARQTPNRAQRMAKQMESGQYELE